MTASCQVFNLCNKPLKQHLNTYLQDLHAAMKMLGLNPMEQEIVDLTNTITRNGFIYFPDFCKIVLKRWREVDEEVFRQNMFKVIIIVL